MAELTTAKRDAAGIEAEATALLEELSYVPALEVARELINTPADLDAHHASLLADAIRRMVAARATPVVKPLAAPPKGRKAPPIRSKPVKLAKPDAPRLV